MSNTHVDFTTPEFVAPGPSEGERFFYDNAAYHWNKGAETQEEGHWRCARMLRRAELHAERMGWRVEWEQDHDGESMDVGTEWEGWPQYAAALLDAENYYIAGLGGVMFKDQGDWFSDSAYARVVAAELALEAMSA